MIIYRPPKVIGGIFGVGGAQGQKLEISPTATPPWSVHPLHGGVSTKKVDVTKVNETCLIIISDV